MNRLIIILAWILDRACFFFQVRLQHENVKDHLDIDPSYPLCFVLRSRSLADLIVLFKVCRQYRLPAPMQVMERSLQRGQATCIALQTLGLLQPERASAKMPPPEIQDLISLHRKNKDFDINIIPASVFWGRNPGNEENSLMKLLFVDEERAGILQKFFIVLYQCRQIQVTFGKSDTLHKILDAKLTDENNARKIRRVLRVHFKKIRVSVLGPQLYTRAQATNWILQSQPIRELVIREAKGDPLKKEQLNREIAKYVHEISAEVSYGVIRFLELVLSRLFAKIYHKFHVRGADALRQASVGHELIYLPCHRSHMDYLLSVYVIHRYGINRPHTGAGSNLNIWPIGALLRRGGAFFLRRSFGGNKIYAAVFAEYLHYLMTKHHPMQFFIEGGRSRNGLLLKPKLGMLSMVVQSYLRQDSLPVLIVPVCVSYDRVVEIDSYFKEIYGAKKKRESIGQLLGARKILRQSLGGVYVNFGTPMPIESYFDRYAVDWRAQSTSPSQRPAWLQEMVEHLGDDVIRDINSLTIVNPVALVSFILLALPQRAYGENELLQMIQEIVNLLLHGPWGNTLEVPFVNASEAVDWAIKYSDIQRHMSPVGNVIHLGEEHAHKYTYYRNHMLAIFSIYGCVAQLMVQKAEPISREELELSAMAVLQFLRDAFFIPTHNLRESLDQHISQMLTRGLILQDDQGQLMAPGLLHPRYELLRVLGLALKPFTDRISIANHLLAYHSFENDAQLQDHAKAVSERTALLSGATTLSPYEHAFIPEYIRHLRQQRALTNPPEQSPQIDPAQISAIASTEGFLDRALAQNLGKK